ncbi:MAG: hypothetical protein IAE80_15960 [Anaerolinea sp.]|mgnify:CR=1 FL=1|nr:hypothetical protein [Anaerolinea sp.]
MKNGKCPKCNSTEIYMKHGGLQQGYVVHVSPANTRLVTTDDYICLNCGYLEQYVPHVRIVLKDLATTWRRAAAARGESTR